ncbi:MAG: YesU family protein [Oscillospiraceae bacterium]|nr:YesU family protein [Oscillospiraceae bacterium]
MIDFLNRGINQKPFEIYFNPLACQEDLKNFVLEGMAGISFPQGRLRLESVLDQNEGQRANYVLWCPKDFPADFYAEWKFWPVREPGLCMAFFCAKGINGEDLFSPELSKRTGEYQMYHHGDINAYHVSYFRRKEPDERAFHTCNLRKSYGFHLVAQGADPIPCVHDANPPYEISLLKYGNKISFFIDGLEIFNFIDDGKTYGNVLGGGKIGFRQLAPFIGEYADFKVFGFGEA